MRSQKVIVGLTALIILLTVLMIALVDVDSLSAYGSILAACGSFTAVIWFTGSLKYQAQQLEEQRVQFQQQFIQSQEEGRRNALILAKEILLKAESKALSSNEEFQSIDDIFGKYALFIELKDIYESNDADVVKVALESWYKKEGPACTVMQGIKSAAQVYFLAIGKTDIDYSKPPEEFVFIYGELLWELPFFSDYTGFGKSVSEFMINIQPGREGVKFAAFGVMDSMAPANILKIDEILEDMQAFESKGRKLPLIAERLKTHNKQFKSDS